VKRSGYLTSDQIIPVRETNHLARQRSCNGAAICLNGHMARVYIEELSKHVGHEVTLKGWLAGKRSSGKIHFLQVRDGTGVMPVRRDARRSRRGAFRGGRSYGSGNVARSHRHRA